jgi:hypothetical protein
VGIKMDNNEFKFDKDFCIEFWCSGKKVEPDKSGWYHIPIVRENNSMRTHIHWIDEKYHYHDVYEDKKLIKRNSILLSESRG